MNDAPYCPMLINGNLIVTSTRLAVLNPATEQVAGYVPECTSEQLDRAVESARAAFEAWRHTPYVERQRTLRELATVVRSNAAELATLLTAEQGKPASAAGDEIAFAAWWLEEVSKQEEEILSTDSMPGQRSVTRRLPLGVVGGIVPWNFPILVALWKIGPALLAGNAIILKPSPYTPLATLRMASYFAEILPRGLVNVVTGTELLGPMMTQHQGIDKISFTGSTETGRKIMASSASNLKRLTLELGGNDAAIVLDDFDFERDAEKLFWTAFNNSGQVCVATKRVYVDDKIYDQVAEALKAIASRVVIGNGTTEGVQLGPVQNKMQYDRVCSIIRDSMVAGHKFLVGGLPTEQTGYFVPITILDNPPEESRVVSEEAFGPVLPLLRFKTVEDAIERANASPYGLGGSVWSKDVRRAAAVAEKLQTGTVWINSAQNLTPYAAFAGMKQSGIGVEHGREGVLEYSTPQTIHELI